VPDTRLSFAVFVLTIAGCVRQPGGFEPATEQTADEPATEPSEVRDVDVAYEGHAEEAPQPAVSVPISSTRHHRVEPLLFHLGAGYGALGQLDLASCREHGLEAGYLHMRVTFRNSGRVVHAAVQSSVPPPPEALACIGEQLEVAMVPVFEGDDVTLSKSFFLN
jgi:hypothetical protein